MLLALLMKDCQLYFQVGSLSTAARIFLRPVAVGDEQTGRLNGSDSVEPAQDATIGSQT